MLTYAPGDTLAHRLDPRTKLAAQGGFALAALAHTTAGGLTVLTVVALLALAVARTSPVAALGAFRVVLALLAVAPLLEGLRPGAPWFVPAAAVPPALAGYRVVLLLLVSAAYVRTTPVRDSRAALRWLVPGRAGAFLGVGLALVVRFLPVLRGDLRRIRRAMRARLGTERPVRERMGLVAAGGLRRALARADRLSLALRARCFAWNPTLPALRFRARDAPVLALALALAGWGAWGTVSSIGL